MNLPASPPSGSMLQRPTDSRSLVQAARNVAPPLTWLGRVLLLRRWLVLSVAAVIVAAVAAVVYQLPPIYRASATILIEPSRAKLVSIDEVYGGNTSNREHYQTQSEFLKSRDVALRVIRDLELTEHPLFDPRQQRPSLWQRLRALIVRPDAEPPPLDKEELEAIVLEKLQARLSVTPVRLSHLVVVAFESQDAQLSARVANAMADAYIRADLDARFKMTQTANAWLNERLAVLRSNLDASERALQKYREEAGIIETGRSEGSAANAAAQLEEMTQKLVQARVARSQAEQIYRQVRGNSPARYEVPMVFNNPSVSRAREIEASAQARLFELGQRFGPAHPQYLAAQRELEAAKENTRRQADAVIATLVREYEAALATERSLEGAVERLRASIQDLNRKEIRLSALEREVATNRQLYQTFLSRFKETNATGDFLAPVARIVDPALVPRTPVKPPRGQLVLLALIFGLLLGGALAVYRERSTDVVRSIDDVESRLGRPLLAAVPLLTRRQLAMPQPIQQTDPTSIFSESVRTALAGVQLATIDVPRAVIGFTSTLPNEGKSTLALNYAVEQSRTKSVVLVEMDLRRPSLRSRLRLEPGPGTADFLAGRANVGDCVTMMGQRLGVMPVGTTPDNAMDLLVGARIGTMLRQLQEQFDVIVVDTPPMQLVADALLIGRQCTGLVYVVRSETAPFMLVRRNLERLDAAGLTTFGVLLNGHDFRKAERYYGEYSAYTQYDAAYGHKKRA